MRVPVRVPVRAVEAAAGPLVLLLVVVLVLVLVLVLAVLVLLVLAVPSVRRRRA